MASKKAGQTLRLKDGRRLGYAEYGQPEGQPLFYFHGFPNSRLGAQLANTAAAQHGVRIIALERPGFGLSDFKPGRAIRDWPDDVVEAADALGIDQFAVLGVSGGGPYAAACAAKIPHRLTATAIVSGLGPPDVPAAARGFSLWNRFNFALARWFPLLARLMFGLMGLAMRRSPERTLRFMIRSAPPADKAIMARAEVWAALKDDLREAFRQGSRSAFWEAMLFLRPWGFRLQDITAKVHIWHGEDDNIVPPSMARYLAQAIPECRASFYPGEGHLLIVDRMDEIQELLFPAR